MKKRIWMVANYGGVIGRAIVGYLLLRSIVVGPKGWHVQTSDMTDAQIIEQIERARAKRMKTQLEWGRLINHAKTLANRHNIPNTGRWEDLRDKLIAAGFIAKFVKFTH